MPGKLARKRLFLRRVHNACAMISASLNSWDDDAMSIAACDPEAFYPLRALVSGPFERSDDLASIERFGRTVVLHDEFYMELNPRRYHPEAEELNPVVRNPLHA